jgi:hypothetical protein
MTTGQIESQDLPVWFAVDGERVDATDWHWYPHRFGGAVFLADPRQVARQLPSPPLHPMKFVPKRASVMVYGAHHTAVGREPPYFGFGEMAVVAYVTRGDKPPPPLVPALGKRAMARYGFGVYTLMLVVTNRVAAETYRILTGIPAVIGDIRHEQRLDRERFVCEIDGEMVCDLSIRSDGRPTVDSTEQALAEQGLGSYVTEDDQLYSLPMGGAGVSRCRYGHKAAVLKLGDHPSAEKLGDLKLSRAWVSEFQPDRHFWLTAPPKAARQIESIARTPKDTDKVQGRLAYSPTEGVEIEEDQGLDNLEFDPAGKFTGPTLHDRSRGQRVAA